MSGESGAQGTRDSQAGISGSPVLKGFVVVAARAVVVESPAEPLQDFFRGVATLRKLARRPKAVPEATQDAARATD